MFIWADFLFANSNINLRLTQGNRILGVQFQKSHPKMIMNKVYKEPGKEFWIHENYSRKNVLLLKMLRCSKV